MAEPEGVGGFRGSMLRRVTGGVSALGFGAILNLLAQVTIVPIALSFWGEVKYGEWIVLTSIVLVLKVSDLGMQTYVVNIMCIRFSRHDLGSIQTALHNGLRVQAGMAIFLLSAGSLVILVLPVRSMLGFTESSSPEVKATAILLLLELLVGGPMGLIAGSYRATGRLPRAAFIGAAQQGLLLVSTLTLVRLDAGFHVVAGARVLITVAFSTLIIYDLRRLLPWLRIWPRSGSFRQGLGLVGPSVLFLLLSLSDWLQTQLLIIVVQTVEGAAVVGQFVTLRTLSNLGVMAGGLLAAAVWPEMTRLFGLDDEPALDRVLKGFGIMHLWVVSLATAASFVLAAVLYNRWTVGAYEVDWITLSVLAARTLTWAMWYPAFTLLSAVNRQDRVVLALVGNAIVTVSIAIPLTAEFGIAGTATANLAGDVVTVLWLLPWFATSLRHQPMVRYFQPLVPVLALCVVVPGGVAAAAWLLTPETWAALLVSIAAALLSVWMMWRLLSRDEKDAAARLLRSVGRARSSSPR